MKLKVIGWTFYDDDKYPDGEVDEASYQAILDDIKRNGYVFTGWHHQEIDKCAPVLNDGCIRRFTQRAWGRIMADALDKKEPYAYSFFAFYTPFDGDMKIKIPEQGVNEEEIVPEEDVFEEYIIEADEKLLGEALENDEICLPEDNEKGCIRKNDIMILVNKGLEYRFRVEDIEYKKDLPLADIRAYTYMALSYHTDEEIRQITEKYNNAPTLTVINLKRIK